MPTFASTSSRSVPILDADEVGKQLDLDPRTVEWLRKEPANDDDPILVLNYQNAFLNNGNFDVNKQIVSTALTNLGATHISDNVYKFDDWQTMHAAKHSMWVDMPWCFFHPHLATAQQLNISQQPTITTTAISWFTETTGKLTIQPYEFFEL
ncbi:unnamed protein product [Auanema sp. JU1783]|nr:unnamed protein product [Auanema sp. JU1783]